MLVNGSTQNNKASCNTGLDNGGNGKVKELMRNKGRTWEILMDICKERKTGQQDRNKRDEVLAKMGLSLGMKEFPGVVKGILWVFLRLSVRVLLR